MNFDLQMYLDNLYLWFLTSGVRVAVIIVVTLILLKIASVVTAKLRGVIGRKEGDIEFEKRSSTLSGVVHWVLRVGILTVAAFTLLGEFGVSIGPCWPPPACSA